jgi:hypothetical protein
VGETASFFRGWKPCRSTRNSFSRNRWKTAASLRGKPSMRRTERFGGKPLIAGKSTYAKPKLKHAKDRRSRS